MMMIIIILIISIIMIIVVIIIQTCLVFPSSLVHWIVVNGIDNVVYIVIVWSITCYVIVVDCPTRWSGVVVWGEGCARSREWPATRVVWLPLCVPFVIHIPVSLSLYSTLLFSTLHVTHIVHLFHSILVCLSFIHLLLFCWTSLEGLESFVANNLLKCSNLLYLTFSIA